MGDVHVSDGDAATCRRRRTPASRIRRMAGRGERVPSGRSGPSIISASTGRSSEIGVRGNASRLVPVGEEDHKPVRLVPSGHHICDAVGHRKEGVDRQPHGRVAVQGGQPAINSPAVSFGESEFRCAPRQIHRDPSHQGVPSRAPGHPFIDHRPGRLGRLSGRRRPGRQRTPGPCRHRPPARLRTGSPQTGSPPLLSQARTEPLPETTK